MATRGRDTSITFEHFIDRPGSRNIAVASEPAGATSPAPVDLVDGPSFVTLGLKRLVDVTLGSLLALGALPVVVALGICVAARFRAWPFFVHGRIGRNGRPIWFPKLRTLPRGTPKYASKYDLPTDIGRLASFLRSSHLDELPQLFAVPLGLLSLVGPRPLMPEDYRASPDWYVRPKVSIPQGCTGLWQIGRHSSLLQQEAPEYDLYYARNATIRLDLWILFQTARMVLGLGSPVDLTNIPSWTKRANRPRFEPDLAP